MTEDEWFERGEERLRDYWDYLASVPGGPAILTSQEEDMYLLAWEQAGREMGIVR